MRKIVVPAGDRYRGRRFAVQLPGVLSGASRRAAALGSTALLAAAIAALLVSGAQAAVTQREVRDLVITSQSQRHHLEEVATGHAEYVLIAQCMRGRGFTMLRVLRQARARAEQIFRRMP